MAHSPDELVLRLPHLVAGADLAERMLDAFGRPLSGAVLVVDARGTASCTDPFAQRLATRALSEAERVVVLGAPPSLEEAFVRRARGEGRLTLQGAGGRPMHAGGRAGQCSPWE